jgi:hypothetical protein
VLCSIHDLDHDAHVRCWRSHLLDLLVAEAQAMGMYD